MNLSTQELARGTSAKLADAVKYCDPINSAMRRFDINTPKRIAAFLATVGVESARLTAVEEGLYYREASRLVKIYPRAFKTEAQAQPYVRNPQALSKLLYGGYHGRGLLQLTWEDNYRIAGEALGFDYVARPELLLTPVHAALTAARFWSANGCNQAADRGDMSDVTRRVNGPARLHLAERTAQYAANIQWMVA